MTFKALLLMLVGLLAASVRAAEPVSEEKVREDLERQLREMVHSPPPELVVSFEGLPKDSNYKLIESEFLLDGQPLITPGPDTLSNPGLHRLAVLKVEEGTHTLVSQVTYVNDSWSLFSDTSGRLWKLTATVNIQAQRGLRVKVRVVPGIVPNAPDPRLRIKLTHDVTAEMTAPLVTATPEPPPPEPSPPPEPVRQASGTVATQPAAKAPESTTRLLLKVTSRKRPVAATVYVRGAGEPRELSLGWKARKPTPVELAPGTYVVDVLAKGYLAQSRRVVVGKSGVARAYFSLVRAPTRRVQQLRVKGARVEFPRPPRFSERRSAPRKGTTKGLALLADLLIREPSARLRIEGHTDSREGTPAARQKLSVARAQAVARVLGRMGVDPARIDTVGFADKHPKAPNLTAPGRQLNRRVEFTLLRER